MGGTDDCLSTFVHVYMLHAHMLSAAVSKSTESFDLRCVCPKQARRRRPEGRHSPLGGRTARQLCQNIHCRGMATSHLHRQRTLNFVFGFGRSDKGQRGIHARFANSASRELRGRLQVE